MTTRFQDIAEAVEPISTATPASAALQRFLADDALDVLPVCEEGLPVAMLSRRVLFETFVRLDSHVLLTGGSLSSLTNTRINTVEARDSVAVAAAKSIRSGGDGGQSGFIIVDEGAYVGFAPGASVLKALAQENTDRARAMSAARRRMDGIEQEQAKLLAIMGHELRTPLTGVLGLAELMLDAGRGTDTRTYARAIANSGSHLNRVLDDLLDAAQLRIGKASLSPEPVDLKAFAGELENHWAGQVAQTGVRLTAKHSGTRRVEIDPVRLRQVLYNLVSNALKYAGSGTIAVSFSTETVDEDVVLLASVADHGEGIADADKAKLFDAFEQADQTHAGVGLGLYISRTLTERMGGDLWVEDNPEGGAIFRLCLPVRKAGPRLAVDNPGLSGRRNFELGRILIIEDHETTRFVMTQSLVGAGWTVDVASTIEDGLRKARCGDYQAVISDLHLPDGEGEALVSYIRKTHGHERSMPVIAATADVSDGRKKRAFAAGFDDIIIKPIRPRLFVTRLADTILSMKDKPTVRAIEKAVG
ncbi:MAG: ATP-binding protein [Pseudomonadota bacterium]